MADTLRILGIAGSLRRASVNAGLLRAARAAAPEGMEITIHDIREIPLYDGDVEAQGFPAPVVALKEAIRASDGVLIATPEYNYSIPGVLKNAIDWVSRPRSEDPFSNKPLAIMGAGGRLGTGRAQYHLRQVAVELESFTMAKPELLVQRPWEKFDKLGNLTDEATAKELAAFLAAFKAWVERVRG